MRDRDDPDGLWWCVRVPISLMVNGDSGRQGNTGQQRPRELTRRGLAVVRAQWVTRGLCEAGSAVCQAVLTISHHHASASNRRRRPQPPPLKHDG